MKKLSNDYLSNYCLQITLLIHAGINIGDGLHLLAEDETDKNLKEMLTEMANKVEDGIPLSQAMDQAECFPDYIIHMAMTGEETGRTEGAFKSLADYYENQRQLSVRIRNAIAYPTVLFVLMLIIIGVLLVKVLPVFNQVYNQLGGSLTGVAAGLLSFGKALGAALPAIAIIVAIIVAVILLIYFIPELRNQFLSAYGKMAGDRGIHGKVGRARFASALSMGLRSGLSAEESIRMAMDFNDGNEKVRERYEKSLKMAEEGTSLSEALKESGVFSPVYCRMIALGVKSGSGDTVMEELSERMNDEASQAIEEAVGRIEPTIVIVTSILVGVILLSVMLPLMNIMSSIG